MACFIPLTGELLFSVLQRLGSGWVQSSPSSLPGEQSQTICGTICCPAGPACQEGSERLGFCTFGECHCSAVACKLQGRPGSSWGCLMVWKEVFTSALSSRSGMGRTAPVGPPKRHRPLPTKGTAPWCPWPVVKLQRGMPSLWGFHWSAGISQPFSCVIVVLLLLQ